MIGVLPPPWETALGSQLLAQPRCCRHLEGEPVVGRRPTVGLGSSSSDVIK